MQHKELHKKFFILIIFVGLAVFLFSFGTAHAYSIYGGRGENLSVGGGLDTLISPFQSFFQSVNSVGAPRVVSTPSFTVPNSGMFTPSLQNALNQFDAWLYGILGFHISIFFTWILGILSWILGLAKSIVDWLYNLIRVE